MAVCAIMYRQAERSILPWMLLGLFGLLHGLNEWLDMLTVSLDNGSIPVGAQLSLLALSFFFLTEFGRQGLRRMGADGFGLWLYLPLVIISTAGALAGTTGLNAALRYTFGLTGGLMAALALWRTAKAEGAGLLSCASITMALYAMAAGLIVPKTIFFPASYFNHSAFLNFTGIPIQLIRGILAVMCTSFIWNYHQKSKQVLEQDTGQEHPGLLLTVIIIFLLIVGWIGTQLFGREALQEVHKDILQITKTAAAALDVERINKLLLIQDKNSAEYIKIRHQLASLHRANHSLDLIRLVSLKDGKATIIADSVPEEAKGHKEPGELYQRPPEELFKVFLSEKSRTAGPYQDEEGISVSGFSPLFDNNGKPLAVLSVVAKKDNWQKIESKYRLVAIVTTLVFSTLITLFFIIRQRMSESARMLSASQRMLEEARLQRQHELEALNRSLEVAVAFRTAKLTESNRELQHFAYIASHDLQEPLRSINSFIQLLAKRYQGKLDKDADDFIGFVTDGVKRMQQLINDLLAYSRVESQGAQFLLVEGNKVLEIALLNLTHSIRQNCVEITYDDLPQLYGDQGQLVQLFQNLISNAIKFRGNEPPRIHVGCLAGNNEWEISIRDNGIGIEQRFFERIFDIFQRLHSREQYTGTGIGLAICRKIVERHGGKIRVSSEPGKGSSFIFTIARISDDDLSPERSLEIAQDVAPMKNSQPAQTCSNIVN